MCIPFCFFLSNFLFESHTRAALLPFCFFVVSFSLSNHIQIVPFYHLVLFTFPESHPLSHMQTIPYPTAEPFKRQALWVTVEGPIGAGKSELLKMILPHLQKQYGKSRVCFVPENVERLMESGLFQKAQHDPKRYTYQLQTMFFHARTQEFLSSLYQTLEDLFTNQDETLIVVSERSILSDAFFMHIHHELGNIDDGEMGDYSSLHSMWRRLYPIHPSLIVYCKASAGNTDTALDTCQERIKERGRDSEQELVTKDYNKFVLDEHERAFSTGTYKSTMTGEGDVFEIPVLVFDTSENYRDDPEIAYRKTREVLRLIEKYTCPSLVLK